MAEDCGQRSDVFLELAMRSRCRGMTFLNEYCPRSLFYSGTFEHLFTTIAQDLNMTQLAWSRIRYWLLIEPGPDQSYLDTLQRSLNITRDKLSLLNSFEHFFPREYPSFAQAIRQAIDTVSGRRKLREAQRSIIRLAKDAKYLQEQCRVQ